MNCANCSGQNPDPNAARCVYCQQPLAARAQHGDPRQGHAGFGPELGYGPPQAGSYGAPPSAYGAPPGGYAQGYGAQNPQGWPNQPNASGFGQTPIQPFGGGYSPPVNVAKSGGFWSTFGSILGVMNLIRIAIVVFILGAVGLSTCISSISEHL